MSEKVIVRKVMELSKYITGKYPESIDFPYSLIEDDVPEEVKKGVKDRDQKKAFYSLTDHLFHVNAYDEDYHRRDTYNDVYYRLIPDMEGKIFFKIFNYAYQGLYDKALNKAKNEVIVKMAKKLLQKIEKQ